MKTTRSNLAERDPWPADSKPVHLEFLRWLAEHDMLEHPSLGPPSGSYAPKGRTQPSYAPAGRTQPSAPWSGRYPYS
jgi:hypothetical protein